MKVQKYQSLKQKYLYVESSAFPFVNVRLYSNNYGTFDVYCLDGYGNYYAFDMGLPRRKAIRVMKQYWTKYGEA